MTVNNLDSKDQLADLIRQAIRPSNSGDYAEAYRRLDELQQRFPESVEPIRWKANLLDLEALEEKSRLGEEDISKDERLLEARRCYQRILELQPEDTVALVDLAEDDERRGDIDRAIQGCDRALELLDSGHFVHDREREMEAAYDVKIRALEALGRGSEAEALRLEALSRLPDSTSLRKSDG